MMNKPDVVGRRSAAFRATVALGALLAIAVSAPAAGADYQQPGVVDRLPAFAERLKQRLDYPLSWMSGSYTDFAAWRELARAKVFSCFLNPPPTAPWDPVVIAEQDRGSYVARKIVFNVTGDSRVLAYLTVPKGPGPFPAVLLLHSHDGKFDIGKEKVVRPWGIPAEKLASAEALVRSSYGGRYIGDVLAERGYVCLVTDALNWSDRGGGGYEGQPALASNLMHLGMSLAGVIAWEDLRAAEFLSQQPEVDPRRIAAMGLSMGAFRSWQVAAMSDHIAAAVSICWMSTVSSLLTPGNNQTTSPSAFAMLHPGLLDDLDYPDIASIGCPKPMLFFNGRRDGLFPQDGVESAYAKMHAVWNSQGAGDRLVTKTWDVGHTFNLEMQAEAFAWLDHVMAGLAATPAGNSAKRPRRRPAAAANLPKRKPKPDNHTKLVKTNPEITWSIMHPVKLDLAYMREVIAAAANYHVDSFEICGDAHGSRGGLDGAIRFRDYPQAAAGVDAAAVDECITALRQIVTLAHESGRPVYYWHREVMVSRAIVEQIPGLLDENGEFDLMGSAYQNLVRAKIGEFFDNVPEMDGLVLTLTESDYSVIHNSDPRRYPPRDVVQRVVATFADELQRRGKRFILRSFGSIAQDYEDILAGAQQVRDEYPFEIETKITPYDFSPFLPFNPYLRRTGTSSLSAECDSIGEFLGAGFLPAPDPARMIDSVNYARQQGVDRYAIRVDRIGHATFASTQAINLLAFDRAIADPKTTAEAVWQEWAAAHWPGCAAEMTALMQRGIEMVKKTHFIDGHVIFHAFPIQPDLKWIQACGILSVFSPGVSLASHQGMWGILPERTTPARENLLREKDEAVAMADEGLKTIERLRDRLPEAEYQRAEAAWRRSTVATRAIRDWCRGVCAYFDDLEHGRANHPALDHALAQARADFGLALPAAVAIANAETPPKVGGPVHEYGDGNVGAGTIESAYIRPICRLLELMLPAYDAEFRERARWRARPGVVDCVVPGGFLDDIRVDRAMHASHARLLDGRPARFAGNRVFPNGFIDVQLAVPAQGPAQLVINGNAGATGEFQLTINGQTRVARFSSAGEYVCDLGPAGPKARVAVRIQKHGASYPAIFGLATIATAPGKPPAL